MLTMPSPTSSIPSTQTHHRWSLSAVLLFLSVTLLACPKQPTQPTPSGPPKRTFYQLKLTSFANEDIEFNRFYHKVVLVDFFATSCSLCEVVIIPLLKTFHQRYHKQGLRIVGVAMQPQAKIFLPPFIKVLQIPYTVVIGTPTFSQGQTVFGKVNSIPRSYLVDRCGQIRRVFSGKPDPKLLEYHLQVLLKEQPKCPK